MYTLLTIAAIAATVATFAQHKAKAWRPGNQRLATRLMITHSVR